MGNQSSMDYNLLEFLESLIDLPLTHEKPPKFNQPLSMIFQTLQPHEPKPLPNPLPHYINPNLYCHFHQMIGHTTNDCRTLKNAILYLIDSEKVKDLEKKPSAEMGPLSEYWLEPHTKSKSLLNYPTTLQPPLKPDIIPFGSHESQRSDKIFALQIPPTF